VLTIYETEATLDVDANLVLTEVKKLCHGLQWNFAPTFGPDCLHLGINVLYSSYNCHLLEAYSKCLFSGCGIH